MITKHEQEKVLGKALESSNDLENVVIEGILHWSYLSSDEDPIMIIHKLLSLTNIDFSMCDQFSQMEDEETKQSIIDILYDLLFKIQG